MSEVTCIVLPTALRAIAPLASQDAEYDSDPKYRERCGVKLTQNDDGTYTAMSTDGRYAGIIKGKMMTAPATKFPNIPAAVPTEPPIATVYVNAARLAQLLLCAEDVTFDSRAVVLEIRGPGRPIVVRASNGDGTEFTGLLVPCEAPKED